MKAKGKIILSSIALVLVVTLAIVAVFALTQTSTSSTFKVNFIGTRNVKATINAKSKLSDSDTIIETPASVTFEGTDNDTTTKSIDFNTQITIPSTDVTADFIFEIYNNITDAQSNELIIEPGIEENGLTDATITTYYQTKTGDEFSKFTGSYTYATLKKDQAIRFKVSVKINDGTVTDLSITDVKISFKLYTSLSAPENYADSSLSVETSNLLQVGDKVSYGEYPQTYVGSELNSTLNFAAVKTGKTYTIYMGSDTATTVEEYSYNGQKYARVEKAVLSNSNKTTFTNGEKLTSGYSYFFKVEPISFVVMEIENGKLVLQAEKVLCTHKFGGTGWADSDLRTYINDTFAKESGLDSYAVETIVKNNTATSGSVDGDGENTTDKLYIASSNEIGRWYLGRDEKVAKSTDFAMAAGVWTGNGSYDCNGAYLLRSNSGSGSALVIGDGNACGTIGGVGFGNSIYGFRSVLQVMA